MKIKLTEIQTVLSELKADSQAMAHAEVKTAVEQLDTMLNEIELQDELAPADSALDLETHISTFEQFAALLPQIFSATAQKEPFLWLLFQISATYRGLGDAEKSTLHCEQILELTENGECSSVRAAAFKQLGILQFFKGNWDKAETYYQKSLEIYKANNEEGYAAAIYNNLGYIAVQQGDFNRAKQHHQRAIEVASQESDAQRILAGAHSSLGIIASVEADWDAALDHFEESINIYEELDLPQQALGVYANLAMTYVDAGELEAAGECYAEATALAEKAGNLHLLAQLYVNRAEFLLNISNIEAARLYCNKALAIFQQIEDAIGIADVFKLYGRIHRHNQKWDEATAAFNRSIQRYQSCHNPQGEAEGCYEFGLMYRDCQNPHQARYFLDRSRLLYTRLGATVEVERINTELETLTTIL